MVKPQNALEIYACALIASLFQHTAAVFDERKRKGEFIQMIAFENALLDVSERVIFECAHDF